MIHADPEHLTKVHLANSEMGNVQEDWVEIKNKTGRNSESRTRHASSNARTILTSASSALNTRETMTKSCKNFDYSMKVKVSSKLQRPMTGRVFATNLASSKSSNVQIYTKDIIRNLRINPTAMSSVQVDEKNESP